MIRARVKPELVRWVREDAGLSVDDVARKTGTSTSKVQGWESGEGAPTIRQLRLLANAAKRPIAVFYLSEPPTRFQAMHDFRRLPGDPLEGSPALRLAIRTVVARREVALELAQLLGQTPEEHSLHASLDEDVGAVAERVRSHLDVSLERQRQWTGGYAALNGWRDAIEHTGVMVFQVSGVELSEMRGFSLSEPELPVIALNIRDAPNGRVFTMLHELCHLALRQGGLCDLTESGSRPPEDDRIEVFCNAVAAEALIPRAALLASPVVQAHGSRTEWAEHELRELSREFSVSREVALRRLLSAGRTTRASYQAQRRAFLEEYERRRSAQSGRATPDTKAVSQAGHAFVRMVLHSYYQERITSRDVSEYLGVRLKHLPSIEERVMGRPVMFT